MTTIACNKETMAADSQFTEGHLTSHGRKIFQVKGDIAAFAGDQEVGLEFIEWLNGGDKPELPLEDFEGLVLTKEGKMIYYGCKLRPAPVTESHTAIGSGSHLAIGALMQGATPEAAVRIACKRDAYSSGPVKVFHRKKPIKAIKKVQ